MNSAVVFGAPLWSGYALPAGHPENGSPRPQPAEVPLINGGNLSRQSRPPLMTAVQRQQLPGVPALDELMIEIFQLKIGRDVPVAP
jgi:hypothetical protein